MHPIDGGAAPISTFPIEILQTIFSLDQSARRYELRPNPRYPQLRLAHVCRRWRYAAFGIPSLWNKIQVSLQCDPEAPSANGHALWSWRDALDMFLSFAKNVPLMVEIVWWDNWSDAEALSEFRPISAALFQTSPRWKALSLSFQYEIDWSLLDPLHAKLPLLEDLSFDVNKAVWKPSWKSIVARPCNAFSVVPSLRSVRFQSRLGGLARLEIPWHQITRLSTSLPDMTVGTQIPHDEAAAISRFICNGVVRIGSSAELKELSVHDPRHNCASPSSSIVLPSLARLSFYGGIYLVGSLILPALRELTLLEYFRGPTQDAVAFDIARELICRSKCTITVLNIERYVPWTAQPLADIAVHFLALTHLSIRVGCFSLRKQDAFTSILALLTPAPSSFEAGERHMFPLLEHLTLAQEHEWFNKDDVPVSPAIADALCDMLELRYPLHSPPPRLFTRAAIIPSVDPPPPTLIEEFKRSVGRAYTPPSDKPFPSTFIEEFKRSAEWARITRVYQGQLNISIRFAMRHGFCKSDFEIWLGRTEGGR